MYTWAFALTTQWIIIFFSFSIFSIPFLLPFSFLLWQFFLFQKKMGEKRFFSWAILKKNDLHLDVL
jgi:hypothetical protein